MIEETIYDYLTTALYDVPVYMVTPDNPRPDGATFVRFEKTGSGIGNQLKNATIAVQSYAPTLYDAMLLNEDVKTAMLAMVSEKEIASVKLNSDYNYTDTSTKTPRYQAVFVVYHY